MQNLNYVYRLLFAGVALLLICAFANAQLSFKMDSYLVPPGGQVVVPIKVAAFDSIISLQGTVDFDTTVIKFASVEQMGLSGMNASNFGTTRSGNGKLTYAWSDATLNGVTLVDSSIIFAIRFNVVGNGGQQSVVSFTNTPTIQEVVDVNFNTVITNYVNGLVAINNISGAGNLTFKIDTVTASVGSQVKLAVRAWNFKEILSIQGTIAFNQNIITYDSVGQFGLPGLNNSNFGNLQTNSGKFTFSWLDATLSGVTIADSTIIFILNFNVIGSNGQQSLVQFANTPTSLEFVDTSYSVLQNNDLLSGFVNVIAPLSSFQYLQDNTFAIYPNPTNGFFHLSLNSLSGISKDISIYDAFGKQVYQILKTNKSDLDFDISQITKGIYFVKVVSEAKVAVSRVVVM